MTLFPSPIFPMWSSLHAASEPFTQNGLAYHTSGLYYKQVTIVIYDRNDSGLYYKTRDDCN